MVLVNFDTGEPLVPGDMEYDDSKPTEEHVLQIFDTYKDYFPISRRFTRTVTRKMSFISAQGRFQYRMKCQLIP